MGDRAVITTEKKEIGVYVHWDGDRGHIEAFLKYCKLKGFRCPERDDYGWARLVQVIANYFGGDGLSVGINKYECLDTDNGDNGVYVIKNWEIVDRLFCCEDEGEWNTDYILNEINNAQPDSMKLEFDND